MSILPQERIGLTGPNGAGKTTLFSIILGETESSGGAVQMQKNLKIGYLPQEARFHSDRTVLEEVTSGDAYVRQLLQEKRYYEEANKADQARYG
ncbi:MAG: ATP-binding cassette domain-containing protein, partial [Candidatus Omnitrophota bacterium]